MFQYQEPKTTKTKNARMMMEEMKSKIKLLFNSRLTFLQKMDALKTYLLPQMDYMLENGQFSYEDLNKLDMFIRGSIDREIGAIQIPIDFFYTATSHGGLGLNMLTQLQPIKQLSKLGKMLTSYSEETKTFTRMMIREEEKLRKTIHDDNALFLDWAETEDGNFKQNSSRGTNCAAAQEFQAAHKLNIGFRIDDDNVLLNNGNEVIKCTNAKDLHRCMKTVLKKRHYDELKKMPVHGHSFRTTGDIKTSNKIMSTTKRKRDTKIAAFTIMARTNTLPTPEILALMNKRANPLCEKCSGYGESTNASLAHIINKCKHSLVQYKNRHNWIVNILIKAIKEKQPNAIIHESQSITLNERRLTQPNSSLLPDIWYINSRNEIEIIEVSIPYGTTFLLEGNEVPSLSVAGKAKQDKYESLRSEAANTFNLKTNLHVIIVSSLGAIPRETHETLLSLFNSREAKIMEERMSYKAILGSALIFWGKDLNAHENEVPSDIAEGLVGEVAPRQQIQT